ncbi:hypothetical protein HU200_053871 [Digitaria exilis]|uniref:Uncharacterized protein n=1 Tax=Digitaria exilis TaxID=1010633 RepID=A0A835ARH6_9POAL|nr:hypothetical protein HU200_053871 [Digitaria exilis]
MTQLRLLLLAAVLALAPGTSHSFEFHEATLDAIHSGFKNGSLTSTSLVQFYLGQINLLNPLLRAVIDVNPDALRQAAQADAERLRQMIARSAGCTAFQCFSRTTWQRVTSSTRRPGPWRCSVRWSGVTPAWSPGCGALAPW